MNFMARFMSPFFVWHREWLVMCVYVYPIPLVCGGSAAGSCAQPNSLQATDCGLHFSFPLCLINGCIDKQTSWATGSGSGRGRRDDDGEWGRKRWWLSLCSSCCWRLPCFLSWCHSAVRDSLMCACLGRSRGFSLQAFLCVPLSLPIIRIAIHYVLGILFWMYRKHNAAMFEKVSIQAMLSPFNVFFFG